MPTRQKPNVIYIYADDLGRGMLSCYGQKYFKTPNIDRIAEKGVKFTTSYGCVFCAPARASLLLGRHDCHMGCWTISKGGVYQMMSTGEMDYDDLRELINNTGIQASEDDVFLPQLFKRAGYVTGEVGKLEWGFSTTPERIERHGWDYHYGYYDHVRCHGFYPPFLFENGKKIDIPGNTHADCAKHPLGESPEHVKRRHDMTGKAVYSQDLFDEKVLNFIRKNKDNPFFLYHPSQLPHGPISIPELDDAIKDHPDLTQYEKEYASMVLRLDKTVGFIYKELDTLGLTENTIVCFSSDNGHLYQCYEEGRTGTGKCDKDGNHYDDITTKFYSELSGDVFDGNDGMAGLKTTNWEGGARIPYLISWPGKSPEGIISEQMFANYDLFATFAELLDQEVPPEKDSISILPTILGENEKQVKHDFVIYSSMKQGASLITDDGWKLRRVHELDSFDLFYLPDDYREENDLSEQYPGKVEELSKKMLEACEGDFEHGIIGNHGNHWALYDNKTAINYLENT